MFALGNDNVHNSMREIVGIKSSSPNFNDSIKGLFLFLNLESNFVIYRGPFCQ